MQKLKSNLKKIISFFANFLPIKKNQILFFSYYGAQYGCNPKYISEHLQSQYGNKIKIIWAFTNPKDHTLPYRKIKYGSIKFIFAFATSRIICTNFNLTTDLKKKEGQIYIQTWHCSLGLKKGQADAEKMLSEQFLKMAKQDSSQIDYILCGSEFMYKVFEKSFWYTGKILKSGTPRNDILFNPSKDFNNRIKQYLGINEKNKILLYAPTFRNNNDTDSYIKDFDVIHKTVTNKFGGMWDIIVKYHPHLYNNNETFNNKNYKIINATKYNDISELLSLTDVLITDFSSLMFDFALTKRPVFLFAKDANEYLLKERGLYFSLYELPFPFSTNINILTDNILDFNLDIYLNKLKVFFNNIGTFEDGYAIQRVSELIYSHLK